ncbi:MAG: efflux RND transporter permease subunit, partial [Desulfovermiculus sp.]|nr:efflux RND transporter permease subunit [Desulfovermiculus sp.]
MIPGSRQSEETSRGPLAWMAGNSVAANLIMLLFLVGGLITALNIKQEVFPEFSRDVVSVVVPYPGASPEEVEQGIVLAVEEAVQGLEGVKEVRSTASEGRALIQVEAIEGQNMNRLWQDVDSEVSRITTFPDEAEEPEVTISARKRGVMTLALYGAQNELVLREAAEVVRDELLQDPGITQVELDGVRDFEVHIEISRETLRRFGLTLEGVARTIRLASVDLGAGSVKTRAGDVLVRIQDRRSSADEYGQIPVLTKENGAQILLADMAEVTFGFADAESWATVNGLPAVMIDVFRIGDQTPGSVSKAAGSVIEELNASLPGNLQVTVLRDRSDIFQQRADLLLTNAFLGLGLVFFLLALFLEARLAFWVSLGIPISFLGSFLFLSGTDFSVNMITMFAFIVTLGIVVDDAIVVGENIYHHRRQGQGPLQASILGVREVAMPVVFSVLTNMVAFLPMFFIPGVMGKIFKFIPMVVICVFAVSLIESLFVLPSHLAHIGEKRMGGPLGHLS